jgi:MFS superfamily sulfate permease-like transporter
MTFLLTQLPGILVGIVIGTVWTMVLFLAVEVRRERKEEW